MKPFFSVVIPLYNKEEFIEDTLKSVLNQTFQDFEIIVVNDGSTDQSLKIVNKLKTEKIRLFTNKNGGLSFSRNFGIKQAKADFIAFLDADDLWAEDFLETIFKLIKKFSKHSLFTTAFKVFAKSKHTDLASSEFDITLTKNIANYTQLSKILVHIGAMVVHKRVFNKVGCFDEHINYAEDEDFYIRAFSETNFDLVYYTLPKAFYRILGTNQLTSPNPKFKRNIPNFESYATTKNIKDLKPYLDAIHYKLLVLYKMERNKDLVRFYKQKISNKNLNLVQKIKFHLPIWAFYYSKRIYLWFSNRFIQS
ncbi:glycosyltransferase family A protein [Flavobacteriaceae bacterium SZ-1-7]|uniref:glycosyltransferase family 2 protein n=1 Tax=Tamlana sedimenti TaxID=3134126 RepID=UPI0031291A5E